jgi:hypothetical protein
MLLIGYELNVSINYLKTKSDEKKIEQIINNPESSKILK